MQRQRDILRRGDLVFNIATLKFKATGRAPSAALTPANRSSLGHVARQRSAANAFSDPSTNGVIEKECVTATADAANATR